MDYPPNSDKSKREPREPKRVERVTTGDATVRKQSLGKQFRSTFLAGDAKSTAHYVVFGVLIPAAKDAIADAGSQGLDKLIFGESRGPKRRTPGPSTGATGYVSYNRMTGSAQRMTPSDSDTRRSMSRRARAQHDFDEIILPTRTEAEDVIDGLFNLVGQYEAATVADMYQLVGLDASAQDHKWGWTDMRGANAARVRNGFLLDLPDPEPLD